jgi:hypothetical protein
MLGAALVLWGCGQQAVRDLGEVQATRAEDGRVTVTVAVTCVGAGDDPCGDANASPTEDGGDTFCVEALFKPGRTAEQGVGGPSLDLARECVTGVIRKREQRTLTLVSSVPLPTGAERPSILVTLLPTSDTGPRVLTSP